MPEDKLMVERVARAICVALGDDPEREGLFADWFDCKADRLRGGGTYGDIGRAAISATGVEGLRDALKPFARVADMEEREPDGASVFVNVSRCRDARAAIAKAGGQEA